MQNQSVKLKTIQSKTLPKQWIKEFTLTNEGESLSLTLIFIEKMPVDARIVIRLSALRSRAEITLAHIGKKDQETNIDITLIHDAPETYGRIIAKSALFDQSKFVFRGMLDITEKGKGSDSYLLANALMLSEHARAEVYPYLEIKTDEVRASHGSSVGRIDPQQMFYLQSRGINQQKAERIILAGFFGARSTIT